ncbi:MAG: hypothetical protein ABW034_04070 [Steroidobacteraceae bacterium]
MSKQNVTLREIRPEELGRHEPPSGAHESWQESWGFIWHDPHRRAGGMNHISIQRLRGIADVWSWVAVNGKVVGKYQNLKLPLPEKDFPSWSLGGQTITTESGRRCRVELSYESASADLHYESHTDPIAFSLDAGGGMSWGSSHYESIGRVNGTVTANDGAVRVSGFAWQDHSWGPRRWADVLSHRWLVGEFGPDLFVSAIRVIRESTPEGLGYGFVYDNGKLHRVEQVTYGSRMSDDGHTPVGCDVRIWTEGGHGYRVQADVHLASPSSHLEGFWFTDGLAALECGGRLGSGIFEVQELNRPAPWHRELSAR